MTRRDQVIRLVITLSALAATVLAGGATVKAF
jgi:hypothetical protein